MLCKVTHCAVANIGSHPAALGRLELLSHAVRWLGLRRKSHYYWYTTFFFTMAFSTRNSSYILCVIQHRQLRYTVLLQQLRIIWSCRQFDINLLYLGSNFTCVAMVTCMQVLHRLHQCSCKEKLEVKSCGHGKFVITKAGKKMTLYARVRNTLHGPFHELLLNCKY